MTVGNRSSLDCWSGRAKLRVRNRDRGSRVSALSFDGGFQLIGQRLDDAGAKTRPVVGKRLGRSDAIVADRQCPVGFLRVIIDKNLAASIARESMLERVDHQFVDYQV